tara:strand:+ start:60 stop:362 length:303 start_codon:yes stop_codon:yes gene_type:complete
MEINKKNITQVQFGADMYSNVYISHWGKHLEITLQDNEADGTEAKFELQMSIDKARSLVQEMSEDIANYDKEQKAKRLELEREAQAAAEAENSKEEVTNE